MPDSRAILSEHGIPASAQRLAIYDYLVSVKTHPSVDDVYAALRERIPTLSRTTVYTTLRLFCDRGVAIHVPTGVGEMRFDGDLSPHAHFRCGACGGVFDIPCHGDALAGIAVPKGFLVRGAQVALTGLCSDCAAHREAEA